MTAKQESEFVILKHSYTYGTCSKCEGSGKKTRSFRKMTFVEDCPVCSGEGRQRFKTTEEVPLAEALKDYGLIK